MSFQIPFFKRVISDKKHYFGLFLKEQEIHGFILEEKNGSLSIIYSEKRSLSNGWENIVEDTDELLSLLENHTKKTVDEAIIFVFSHFIDEKTGDIKEVYLKTIRQLLKELQLKPLGYIECYEAVVSFFEEKEQSPLTAILLEVDKTNLGIFIYKGGHRVFKKHIPRTETITDDLESIFSELKGDVVLPSRIILYDSADLTKQSTDLISHQWDPELFVQFPRVEIFKEEDLHKGLIHIFAEQLAKGESETMPKENKTEEGSVPKEVMGFVIGGDVSLHPSSITNKLKLPKLKMPHTRLNWVIGLFLILSALFIGEYFFHRAQVIVFFPSKSIAQEEKLDLALDGNQESSLVKMATASGTYTEKKSTTGKREIGEKANGEVTIHNFDDKEKTFAKGTLLETSGISFILDGDVKVASASESIVNGGVVKQPGKVKAGLTAVAIGPEGNLEKGKRLQIADLSSSIFFALNDNAFEGGTKKEVKTVAKQDLDSLLEAVVKKAKSDSASQSKLKIGKDEEIIKDLTRNTVKEKDYSKELGEEASEVSLTAVIEGEYIIYNKDRLKEYILEKAKAQFPDGFTSGNDKVSFSVKDAVQNKQQINLVLDWKIQVVKEVSSGDIVQNLTGKDKKELERILKSELGATGYELNIKSPFFIFADRMPFFKKNIDLKVSSL